MGIKAFGRWVSSAMQDLVWVKWGISSCALNLLKIYLNVKTDIVFGLQAMATRQSYLLNNLSDLSGIKITETEESKLLID